MTTKKTYLQILTFKQVAGIYLSKNAEKENKITSAIKIVSKQVNKIVEDFNDERDSLQINNCATDPVTGIILKDEKGNRQFTPKGELDLKKALKNLLSEKVEIHQRIAIGVTELIKELTDIEKEVFSGIVIVEQKNE